MPIYISSAEWKKIERSLRQQGGNPADYMRRNDVYVDDRMAAKQGMPSAPPIGELPPSPEPNNMAVYGDNANTAEDTEDTGAAEDQTQVSDFSARPDLATLAGILKGQRKSIGDLYDTITQNIQQRYRKPDINDLLIAIGTGMMSAPGENDSGGFGGAVQRGLRGIGTYAQNRRGYETDMNKMLSEIEIAKAKDLAGLEEKYLSGAAAALKPNTGGLNYDSQRGIWVNRNNPRPTQNAYDLGRGRTLVQWQDGLWREQLPDGRYKVFERAGNDFNELRIEEAR